VKFQRKSSGRNAVSRPKPEITIVLIDSLIIQSLLANRPKDHSKIQASSKLYELNLFAKHILASCIFRYQQPPHTTRNLEIGRKRRPMKTFEHKTFRLTS